MPSSCQVIDSGKDKTIGKLEFSLAQLLKIENMTLDQAFPLKDSGHNSTLTCKLTLKVGFGVSIITLSYYESCNLLFTSVQ